MAFLNRATLLLSAALAAGPPLAAMAQDAYQPYGQDPGAPYVDAVSAPTPPPPLVTYEQPPIPAPGYLWTPGYWGWGAAGYYWVPGTWALPPTVGLLWTPPWWGFVGGNYLFHAGYWGPTVGFYGGINYGFGYGGIGFEGGYWRGGAFFYNGAVNRFGGVHITNVYTKNVTNITNVNRVSFNGPGGITRAPTPAEQAALRAPHTQPTALQTQHFQAASQNRALLASVNHGSPPVTAVSRPANFAPHPAAAAGGFRPQPGTSGFRPAPAPGGYRPEPGGYRPGPGPVPGGYRAGPVGQPGFAPRPGAPGPGPGPGGGGHPPAPAPAPHGGGGEGHKPPR